jgi:hypothetical protein
MATKIIIRHLEKPADKDVQKDIEWICECFGFYENIDREKTAASIFAKLLESMVDGECPSSTCLGEETKVTRAAALHHLRKMMASGLVVKRDGGYALRRSSMYDTINEMHRDMDRIFEDIEQIAREIDERIGAKRRI